MLIIGLVIIPLFLDCSIKSATAETSSISMSTDKTRYAQGEIIKLVVKNSLDIPIWYISYPQRDLVSWTIERAKDNGWHRMSFRLPLFVKSREICQIAMYERPIGVAMNLKSNSNLFYEWNQNICPLTIVSESTETKMIERGRYRFALHYSFDTVKSENVEAEPWKRPVDLGEIKVVYSNEFVLE